MILQSSGSWLALKLMQLQAKEMMENIIRHDPSSYPLDIFEDARRNKEISWEEPGSEFRYRGHLYDVVKTEERNGHTTLFCINDSREESICSSMQQLLKDDWANDHSRQGNARKLAGKFLQQLYDTPPASVPGHHYETVQTYGLFNPLLFHNPSLAITKPPPERL